MAAVVELADQDELSIRGGVEVGGERGELFFGGRGVEVRLFFSIGARVVLVQCAVVDVEHVQTIARGCDIDSKETVALRPCDRMTIWAESDRSLDHDSGTRLDPRFPRNGCAGDSAAARRCLSDGFRERKIPK